MENKTAGTPGSLKVSSGVIISIAQAAAAEVEGVYVNAADRPVVISGAPLDSKMVPPIQVRLSDDSAVIDISVITDINYRAYEVAKEVQEHVKSAVQNMTGIAVPKVNVRIVSVKGK